MPDRTLETDAQRLREMLPDILASLSDIDLVYLYGSQCTGEVGPMSDYDLGLLVRREAEPEPVYEQFTYALAQTLGADRVDVVLLNRAPIELAYAIIAQGSVLYERDVATRVEYEADVMSRYGDYLPVLRAFREDILRGDRDGTRVRRYREALGRTERTLGEIASAAREAEERL